jgi:phage-related protein
MKPVIWIGTSLDDLKEFPDAVQDVIGYALHLAQLGGKYPDAKPLGGEQAFRGAGVLEIVDNYDGDTYRAVYTVRFQDLVYVLHCFRRNRRAVLRHRSGTSTWSSGVSKQPLMTTPGESEGSREYQNR